MYQFRRRSIGSLDIQAKLFSENYSSNFIKHVSASDLNLPYIQVHGFSGPLIVIDKTSLGLRVPSHVINVRDITKYTGHNFSVDIVGADPHRMTIGNWSDHWLVAAIEGADSLRTLPPAVRFEFSSTPLSQHVEAPQVVRQLDWVDRVWPKHLKQHGRSAVEAGSYPKVQKYCLIAMRSCFVGFTTGIGGSSSWFHVLRGQIIFWLLPPLEKNFELLEKWIASGRKDDVFLADEAEECQRFNLTQGRTLFLPSGWIYAMFLGDDMLAFHGSFLHSFSVAMQHRVWDMECRARVVPPMYPFFEQIHWYVLEHYVHLLTGQTYLSANTDDGDHSKAKVIKVSPSHSAGMLSEYHLAELEHKALKDLFLWLQSGRRSDRAPAQLVNCRGLLQAAQGLVSKLNNKDTRACSAAASAVDSRASNKCIGKKMFMLRWINDKKAYRHKQWGEYSWCKTPRLGLALMSIAVATLLYFSPTLTGY